MIKGRLWLTRSATVFYLSRTKNHQFYLLVRLFKIGETPLKKSGVYGARVQMVTFEINAI